MRVALTGGAYKAQSVIANAQRCLNLYPEKNPEDAPCPYTYYQRPGLLHVAAPPSAGAGRCIYRASNGQLYCVVGQNVYAVSQAWAYTLLGTISGPLNPCYIADNGVDAILVNGTGTGWTWDLATNTFATIVDPDFYGGDRVDYVDLRFVLNKPGTTIFYYSDPVAITFQPLDFAAKAGYPDALVSLIVLLRQIWLLGNLTAEIFYNAGAADAIFEQQPGSFMEHGCIAPYSLAKADVSIFWLSQDQQGARIVYEGVGYQAKRISTHAIENEIRMYDVVIDAVGFTFQLNGHLFYVLTFPTANKTWVFDKATALWSEWSWTDPTNGTQLRHRANGAAFAYGYNLAIDWENGNLYRLALEIYTDDSDPIVFLRSFPHLIADDKRIIYSSFIADMEVGTDPNGTPANPPLVSLRCSDDRGVSYGNGVAQSMGAAGEYRTSIQWNRLGMARDRVFELSWSANCKAALNGAFIDTVQART